MPLFQNQSGKLVSIKEKKFKLEKNLQEITENNLSIIFVLIH